MHVVVIFPSHVFKITVLKAIANKLHVKNAFSKLSHRRWACYSIERAAVIIGPLMRSCMMQLCHMLSLGILVITPYKCERLCYKYSLIRHMFVCDCQLPLLTFHCVYQWVTAVQLCHWLTVDLSHITLMQGKLPAAMKIHDAKLQQKWHIWLLYTSCGLYCLMCFLTWENGLSHEWINKT